MSRSEGYFYEDLKLGMSHESVHTITEKAILDFANVSGDRNPLHMDEEYAKNTIFKKRVAHGALTASFISGIIGNYLPGPGSIFVDLFCRFRRPVYIGSEVHVHVEITEMQDRGNRVTLSVKCITNGKIAISGHAKVMVPGKES